MKKIFNKVKVSLATLGVAIVSFFSKVTGQSFGSEFGIQMQEAYGVQALYGVPSSGSESLISFIIKIAQRALVGITFIIGIVNLIKIRKTGDKVQKKKKIKKAIIILAILVVILLAAFLVPALLLKK